ncbi:MAG TPA: LLM class flavin-dependent oxidoreductase [Myxococcota bacterium]|nr:LLM class flavin-dependent oxidoreductase [Myxococcota bacterium]
MPGRRRATLDLASEIERRGFAGIYCPSFGDGLGLCEALALATTQIPFGTSIANIYLRHVSDYAQTAALVHELSGGRFVFGIGVSHGPALDRVGVKAGPPLGDMRAFVAGLRGAQRIGELPPIVLATLRTRMVALSGEVGDGMVFANAARSHMKASLAALPPGRADDPRFFVGDMIPTCISDDEAAAAAVNRKTLVGYVSLPNYRNYWREAGYVDEMNAIEKAVVARKFDEIPALMSDRWLSDVTLYGSVRRVREGLEAWFDAGVKTPILVPSSALGNQMKAFEELFACFA